MTNLFRIAYLSVADVSEGLDHRFQQTFARDRLLAALEYIRNY
jgi:hypothetical protein